MDAKTVNLFFDIIAFVVVVAIFFFVSRARRKAIENPTGNVLQPGEQKIGEIFSTTRDITFKGFITAGSALEGKLILTNSRLVYTTYDEKKFGLSLSPKELSNIKLGEKGILAKTPAVTLEYVYKKNKSKTATFTFPEVASNHTPLFGKEFKNPLSTESFLELLHRWKGLQKEGMVFEHFITEQLIARQEAERGGIKKAELLPSERMCKGCGEKYKPCDYNPDSPEWLCPACKKPLPKE